MQCTLTRLVRRTAILSMAKSVDEPMRRLMNAIVEHIPSIGVTVPQLCAIVEDEMPSIFPSMYATNSLREALELFPDLLRIEQDSEGRELVKPCDNKRGCERTQASIASIFFDVQRLLKYCKSMHRRNSRETFIRLEEVLQCSGVHNVDIVNHLLDSSQKSLEVKLGLNIKFKRPPRAAIVFVDGDELPPVAVDDMCDELNLIKPKCTMHIVRHQDTVPLSQIDVISPAEVPTFLIIEKKAHELRLRNPCVLQDVVYMCSNKQYRKYAQNIARLNPFPDADVYLCCPNRIEVIQPKVVIPFQLVRRIS